MSEASGPLALGPSALSNSMSSGVTGNMGLITSLVAGGSVYEYSILPGSRYAPLNISMD
jgi:hypothetical protein